VCRRLWICHWRLLSVEVLGSPLAMPYWESLGGGQRREMVKVMRLPLLMWGAQSSEPS